MAPLQKATGIDSSVCAGKAINFVRGLGAAKLVRAQFRQKGMIVEVEMFWFREGKVLDEPREGSPHLRGSVQLGDLRAPEAV